MPSSSKQIFNHKILKSAVERLDLSTIPDIEQKQKILDKWKQAIESGKLKGAGEVSLHGAFVSDLFSSVLGYDRITDHPTEWNLVQEQKTDFDATTPDAALGFFMKDSSDTRVVIELKSADADLDAKQHRKNDKRSAVEQAFSYAPKSGKHCDWILVSNYLELRLYHTSLMSEYESFRIAELGSEGEFKRFYALLARENLIAKDGSSVVDALYRKSDEEEKNISKRFYAEYTKARAHLFEHLKQRNPEVDELLLLEKTQKLLDRFIFVCFCEDSGMLPERIFRKVVTHAKESFSFDEQKVWTELKGLFAAIDRGSPAHRIHAFNGELFKPDPVLDTLRVGDEIFTELAEITDYDFDSDLNVNILGHIFEQSISDLEELRAAIGGEQIDRKQGKRKKEGVFYTPEYITRYIVEQALGGWLEERKQELGFDELPELTPEDYGSIKTVKSRFKGNRRVEQHRKFWEAYKERLMSVSVLDPACGSGAFLNQAFDFLAKEGERVNKAQADLSLGQSTVFDLNRHILSNNLYGVDLNRESVEITKLSLWLKTANKGSRLTALDDNIKCGNSLIDDPLVAEKKTFNWEQEFPDIMQRGGFDVVIGNPPYVRQEALGPYKSYFEQVFQVYHGVADLYVYFIERGASLLKSGGVLSFITSSKWMRANYGKPLRIWLKQKLLHEIIDFGALPVFEDATTYTCILRVSPDEPESAFKAVDINTLGFSDLNTYAHTKCYSVPQISLQDDGWALIDEKQHELITKLKHTGKPLKEYVENKIYYGIKTGFNDAFVIDKTIRKQIVADDSTSHELIKPFLVGQDIKRYQPPVSDKFVIFTRRGTDIKSYPAIEKYLSQFKERLTPKPKGWAGGKWQGRKPGKYEWYEIQDTVDYYKEFEKVKILWPGISSEVTAFTIDEAGYYGNDNNQLIVTDDKYLLGVLNSRVMRFVLLNICDKVQGGFYRLKIIYIQQLPIRTIDFSDPSDKTQRDYIVERVEKMLDFHKQRQTLLAKFPKLLTAEFSIQKLSTKLQKWTDLDWTSFEKELKKSKVKLTLPQKSEWVEYFEQEKAKVSAIQQQIERTDREIDRMVYDLYGLTEDEIRIVERA